MSTDNPEPINTSNKDIDPRINTKYLYIQLDSNNNKVYSPRGANLLKLDSYLDELYKNYKLFLNEESNDYTFKLDEYATLILLNVNKIIDMIKPCASNSTDLETRCSCVYDSSCIDSDICMYVNEIQLVLLDYILNLSYITNKSPKTDYEYLPFFILKNTADIITANEANRNLVSQNEYLLCGTTRWVPKSTDPILQAKYNKILTRQKQNQADHTYNFTLRYVIYGIISISVLCMLYLWYKSRQGGKNETN